MQLICVRACELPPAIQDTLKALCMMANQNGGSIRLSTSLVSYDAYSNALIIRSQSVVRFQFDEPKPQYRWN